MLFVIASLAFLMRVPTGFATADHGAGFFDVFDSGNALSFWTASDGNVLASLHQQAASTPNEVNVPAVKEVMNDKSTPANTFQKLKEIYKKNVRTEIEKSDHCAGKEIVVRKEWGDMDRESRLDYLRAVKCLAAKPARTSTDYAPGARTRWDDFNVAHITNTPYVHRSPVLLSWHRDFTFQLERALRQECDYKYGHPYWEYSRYIGQNISTWPMFDDSEISISGNGTSTAPSCACLTSGPLKDFPVNVGPVGKGVACTNNTQDNGLGYNPRCIERFFLPDYLANLTYDKVTTTILEYNEIKTFGLFLESWPTGIHPIPHVFVSGTQVDSTSSPGDPWFFFHHCMLDFIWQIWQSLDFTNRKYALANSSDYAQLRKDSRVQEQLPDYGLDSTFSFSPWLENVTAWQALNPMDERYCYVYD